MVFSRVDPVWSTYPGWHNNNFDLGRKWMCGMADSCHSPMTSTSKTRQTAYLHRKVQIKPIRSKIFAKSVGKQF